MKWVAKNCERDIACFQQAQQIPEIQVQNGVSAGNIKVRAAVINRTKVETIIKRVEHLLPRHGIDFFAGVFGENVAVLAALVAVIGDVPLKRKIRFHDSFLSPGRISEKAIRVFSEIRPKRYWGVSFGADYLSPAPHAVPQAVGFSSGLSPAPHAVPQAADFSSGLSPAPHAVPQAAGFSSGLSPAPHAVPQGEDALLSFQAAKF